MNEELKTFLEENKELIRENRWCELYNKAKNDWGVPNIDLANFLHEGLGQETMLDLFAEEGAVPNYAFEGCRSLMSVTIPNSVTSIGKYAFYGCRKLTSIEFDKPSSVTSIGYWAFFGCDSLPEITIPKSVTSIGKYAFCACTCHIIFECDKNVVTKDVLYNFKGTYEFK